MYPPPYLQVPGQNRHLGSPTPSPSLGNPSLECLSTPLPFHICFLFFPLHISILYISPFSHFSTFLHAYLPPPPLTTATTTHTHTSLLHLNTLSFFALHTSAVHVHPLPIAPLPPYLHISPLLPNLLSPSLPSLIPLVQTLGIMTRRRL